MKHRDYTVLGAKLNKDPLELETVFKFQVRNSDGKISNYHGLERFTVKELKIIKKHFIDRCGTDVLRLSGRKDESIKMLTTYLIATKAVEPLQCEFCNSVAQVGETRCQQHENMTGKPSKTRTAAKPKPKVSSSKKPKLKGKPPVQQRPRPAVRSAKASSALKRKRVNPVVPRAPQPKRSQPPYIPALAPRPANNWRRDQGHANRAINPSRGAPAYVRNSAVRPQQTTQRYPPQPVASTSSTFDPLPATSYDPYYSEGQSAHSWQQGAHNVGYNTAAHTSSHAGAVGGSYSNAPYISYQPTAESYTYGTAPVARNNPGYTYANTAPSNQQVRRGNYGQPISQNSWSGSSTQQLSVEEIDEMENAMLKNVLAISKEESANHARYGVTGSAPQYYSNNSQHNVQYPAQPQPRGEQRSDVETKQEPPGWDELMPLRGNEGYDIQRFAKYGFSKVKVLRTLREFGNNLQQASMKLFQDFTDLQEAKQMDQAALLSEQSGEREAAKQKQQEKIRLEFGDVLGTGEFQGSILLSTIKPKGFRDLLVTEKSPDGSVVIDLEDDNASLCRTLCIKLLVLEKRALKWYKAEAKVMFQTVAKKFNERIAQGRCIDAAFVEKIVNETEEALFAFPSGEGLTYSGKPDGPKETEDDDIQIVSTGELLHPTCNKLRA